MRDHRYAPHSRAMNVEELLPEAVRAKAIVSPGGEYAWRRSDVFDALAAAQQIGLACLGGQVQFVYEDGTCELYWRNFDPQKRQPDEGWDEYVARSHAEAVEQLRDLLDAIDLVAEGMESFGFLKDKAAAGSRLEEHLVFVCYFQAEEPAAK